MNVGSKGADGGWFSGCSWSAICGPLCGTPKTLCLSTNLTQHCTSSLSSGWVAVVSVHRLPYKTLRVMNAADPGGASGSEETVACVRASPSGGRMGLEGLSQIM